MRILISGSSGLIGSALIADLNTKNHQVWRLVRKPVAGEREVAWDPAAGRIDTAALEAFDAVIHLAGENIAQGRWTTEKKARIYNSRVNATRLLCNALQNIANPPKVLLSASAVGYYGDQKDAVLTESHPAGTDFLATLCKEWEAATQSAADAGIRVVNMRFGLVLSREGGLFKRMLTPFKFGLGGALGSGAQYMSWITMDDLIGAVSFLLTNELAGPVNVTAPTPVTNREFTRTLGHVLHRPAPFRIPAFMLRIIFGEVADSMLASTRAVPERLSNSGYAFRFPALDQAFKHLL